MEVLIFNSDQHFTVLTLNFSKPNTSNVKNKYSLRSLIRSSRGFGFSSNKGAYRIIERRLRELFVDGDLKFDRKRERIE